jgi:hypothetical protein
MFSKDGEVYIGQAEFKPKAVVDLIQLGTSNVIADNITVEPNFLDTGIVYDMTCQGEDALELEEAIGRQIVETYSEYEVNLEAVELGKIKAPTELQAMCTLWNYATQTYNYIFEGENAIYMEISRANNFEFTEIFADVLFRYIKPFGFRDLLAIDAPVTIYGGPNIARNSSNISLYKNVFKTPNMVGAD